MPGSMLNTVYGGGMAAGMPLPPLTSVKATVSFTIDDQWTAAHWTAVSYMALGFTIGNTYKGPSVSFWNDGGMDVSDVGNETVRSVPAMDSATPFVVELDWGLVFRVTVNGVEYATSQPANNESWLADLSGVAATDITFHMHAYSPGGADYSGKFDYVDIQGTAGTGPAPEVHGLVKNMIVVETLEQHDIPGTPYVPAKPGYYTYDTQQVCGWKYQGSGRYVTVTDPQTNESHLAWMPDIPAGSIGVVVQGTWVCTNQQVKVWHPATPAQPATPGSSYTTKIYESGFNLGWNAGARSEAVFFQDVTLAFKVGVSDVGAIVGMNIDDGTPVDYNGNTIDFGFYCSHGVARVMRSGVIDPAGGAFTYDANTIFRIERQGDQIYFSKNGSTTYHIPSGAPTGPGWMEAALYSGNDVVYEPVIEYTMASPIPLAHSTLAGYFPPMTARLTKGQIAEIAGVMQPMTAKFHAGGLTPTYALINGDISILSAFFVMLTGEVGAIDASFLPMDGLWADHPYGAIEGLMQPMDGWLLNSEIEGQASFVSNGYAFSAMTAKQQLIATFRSTGQLLALFSADVLEHAELAGRAILGDTLSFTSQQQAVLWSIATTTALTQVPAGEIETWVINLEGGAFGSTQYQNWDFNSYALIDGRYYGAGLDGLALLEGDTDDGAPIEAVVALGKRDAGKPQKKTWQQCYLGMSASGHLFVKVIAEGAEYVYRTRDFNAELQQQRVTFGKGLRTNYVTLEIYNEGGADFELDNVHFIVADMSRKI